MPCKSLTSRQRYIVVALLGLTFLTRLLLSASTAPLADIDSAGYDLLARNLLEQRGFTMHSTEPFCPESVRTPGYPLFLAVSYRIFDHQIQIVFVLQALLETLTAAMVFRLGRALMPGRGFAVIVLVSIAYLLSLSQWHYTNLLLTEILLAFLLTIGVFSYWLTRQTQHKRYAFAAGVFMGAAVLTKPGVELAPVAFIAAFLLIRRLAFRVRLRLMIIFIGGVLWMLAPWYLRNQHESGSLFLSRTYDDNVAHVSAVATLAKANNEFVYLWSSRWEDLFFSLVEQARLENHWSEHSLAPCEEAERQRSDVARVAVRVIQTHPVAFLTAHFEGVINGLFSQEQLFWYAMLTDETLDSVARYLNAPVYELPFLLQVMGVVWATGYSLAYIGLVVGLVELMRCARDLALVLFVLILMGLVLPGPLAWVRFRVPVVSFMVLLYIMGLLKIRDRVKAVFSH